MKNYIRQYRVFVAFTALLCIAALFCAASYQQFPFSLWTQSVRSHNPPILTAGPLSNINKPLRITRTGSVQSAAAVPVNAEFSGLLSELYVTEGQTVKAGQPLFKLQGSPEPAVTERAATAAPDTGGYDNALKEYNRLQKLFEVGAIPRRQLDAAGTRLQEAKESLNSARSTSEISRPASNGSATMNAPVSGIVSGLTASAGRTVQAGQQLLSLGSGQELEAVVSLSQNDLYLVHLGTAVIIEAAQQQILGQVSGIYPVVQANEAPVFLARVKLGTSPQGLLTPGMPVAAHIDTGKTVIVPAVPAVSVFQDSQGQTAIFLAVNGRALLQPVSTGETSGAFIEITSALPQQSLIITGSISALKDGDPVTLTEEKTN